MNKNNCNYKLEFGIILLDILDSIIYVVIKMSGTKAIKEIICPIN